MSYTRALSDPPLNNLQFIQMVSTSAPLNGTTTPYIDPRPNDDTYPFYWTSAEIGSHRNSMAGSISFSDFSQRTLGHPPNLITWERRIAARILGWYAK